MSKQKVLVAGGAGYVGSHCCEAFAHSGYEVVVLDNLVNGHRQHAKWGPLIEADIRDKKALWAAFEEYKPDAVLHFAALIEVKNSQIEISD